MAFRIHVLLLLLFLGVLLYEGDAQFPVNAKVVTRWVDNLYYKGTVKYIKNGYIVVWFDVGFRITHTTRDISAVIADEAPNDVRMGMHVVATWKGGVKYYPGFVTGEDKSGRFKVTFGDNDEANYTAKELRLLPDQFSPFEVGARVFARWTNGLYYRGFVTTGTASTVHIRYDDGDRIDLDKDDIKAVILDKIPCYSEVHAGQRVIGFWPGRTRYYPGVLTEVKYCCFNKVYHVKFDDGDERDADFNQIRFIPSQKHINGLHSKLNGLK